MKTLRILYALMAFVALSPACTKVGQMPDRFNIDATDIMLVDHKEGSTDILLATNRDPVAMVEEASREWLSAEITPRCLTLSYTENILQEERTGKVQIQAGSIQIVVSVTQPGFVSTEPGPDPKDTYELYDLYYEDGNVMGVVFWTSEDGKSALVISLDRTPAFVPWSYDGTNVIGTGADDGAENTALLRASAEATAIPALDFCDEHGEGWYWPAINEMVTLFEVYNGTSYDDATKSEPDKIGRAHV